MSPPKDVAGWVKYLHAAAAVPKDSPDYRDAQEAVVFALGRIRNLNTAQNTADQSALDKANRPQGAQGLGIGLMHGLSLGSGEPIAGLLSALAGNGFGSGAAQYREGLERSQEAQPNLTAAGDVAGTAATAALPVGRGVKGGVGLAESIVGRRPNALARFLTGAMHTDVAPGLALGGIQGFSAGGEDPGDIQARLTRGAITAGATAGTQAALGGLGALSVPRYRMKQMDVISKDIKATIAPPGSPPAVQATAAQLEETAHRAYLKKQGYSDADANAVMEIWRARNAPKPPAPPVLRPGETVEQIAPNGFAVKGPRVTPPAPTTPTVTEILEGRGQTLPYYPRGGMAEQSIAPPPSQAPVQLSPNQNAAFIEFLKGASSPQEQAARVGTLKALGVLPGPNDEAQLLQILGAR